jgi:predicted GNAT superfamily acetyltransferase
VTTAGIAGTVADSAWRVAERAARAADVEVRPATLEDVGGVQDVLGAVWGQGQRLQTNLLMAMSHAGATVASAVRGGVPVGACVGFLGWAGGVHLHSHMAAVRPGVQASGVGYALKTWQRAVCLDHGIDEIRWTYDPLVRRNAYFNLAKLGARVVDYRPDFYGDMDDIVNAGDRSDRFEVSWALVGAPSPEAPVTAGGARSFVALPEDYDALRRTDPAAARAWRERVRAEIVELWDAGLRPVWATAGGYTFQRADEHG